MSTPTLWLAVALTAGTVLALAAAWRSLIGPLVTRRVNDEAAEEALDREPRVRVAVPEHHDRVPVWVRFSCGHEREVGVPADQARNGVIAARCGCRFRGYPVSHVPPDAPPGDWANFEEEAPDVEPV